MFNTSFLQVFYHSSKMFMNKDSLSIRISILLPLGILHILLSFTIVFSVLKMKCKPLSVRLQGFTKEFQYFTVPGKKCYDLFYCFFNVSNMMKMICIGIRIVRVLVAFILLEKYNGKKAFVISFKYCTNTKKSLTVTVEIFFYQHRNLILRVP